MSSVRRLLRPFYRSVHPDLLHGYAEEAVSVNSKSIKELNAYIDRVESKSELVAPFVARTLQFFVPVVNRKGERSPSLTMRPVCVTLPTIGTSADIIEKEEAAVSLVKNIEDSLLTGPMFSKNTTEFTSIERVLKTSARSNGGLIRSELNRIWSNELQDAESKSSIYESPESAKAARYYEYRSIKLHNKLLAKYSKLKDKRKRESRIQGIQDEVAQELAARKVPDPATELKRESSQEYSSPNSEDAKLRIIKSGYHPDLVFFAPQLSEASRKDGIARICGSNLELDEDLWLLENVWKAVRMAEQPPVPVVIGETFDANTDGGYLQIPYNFKLTDLVDFLEENLDQVRAARQQLLNDFIPV